MVARFGLHSSVGSGRQYHQTDTVGKHHMCMHVHALAANLVHSMAVVWMVELEAWSVQSCTLSLYGWCYKQWCSCGISNASSASSSA